MAFIHLLQTNDVFMLFTVALVSLVVGSFLNVVIHRLPIMMHKAWREQCIDLLNDDDTLSEAHKVEPDKDEKYNLSLPRSACPQCGHQITAAENIPIISYLLLKGKCSSCKTPISMRYPIIEFLTMVFSILVAWHFGFSWQCIAALFLTWALIAASVIDFDHKLLPDDITLPLLWIGITLNLFGLFTTTSSSVIGAIAGYLALWSVYWVFKLLTGKEGMGYGDFKLLAMLGAWLGWQALPGIILLSSLVGAILGISLIVFRGRDKNIPIPFGPYLATAGWIYLLWGDQLTQMYFSFAGIQ
jgi:leader peptidase (prepilin peptidase)/N-methyltransferase